MKDEPMKWETTISAEGTIEADVDPATYAKFLEAACKPFVANVFGGPLDGLDVVYDATPSAEEQA